MGLAEENKIHRSSKIGLVPESEDAQHQDENQRHRQRAHKIADVVGQDMELKPDGIGGESPA